MQAILNVESGGRAFAANGHMVIRFEAHIFWDLWGKAHPQEFGEYFQFDREGKRWEGHLFHSGSEWVSFHGNQDREWLAFGAAAFLNREAALKSIAMGAGQVMGFNHETVGYATVEEMYRSYEASATNQIVGMALFIVEKNLVEALRQDDYLSFSTTYNGSGQAAFYAGLIKAEVERLEA
jgi:hypothetical protein